MGTGLSIEMKCRASPRTLKKTKTKEIITGFRQQRRALRPLELGGEEVKRVSCFKLLGIPSMRTLNGQQTAAIIKNRHNRDYFLRIRPTCL